MAPFFHLLSVNFTIISFIFLLFPSNGVSGIPELELEAMLSALRSKGYNLFGNAIMTSDIRYEILAGTSFTFFTPTDAALFSLDMVATASVYVLNLRYHIVHRRFSISDLRSMPSGSSLATLVPNQDIHIAGKRSTESYIITADGVDIVLPGLFYGRSIAVHGLDGILNRRSHIESNDAPPPGIVSDGESFPPKMSVPGGNRAASPRSEPRLDRTAPELSPNTQDFVSPTPTPQSPVSNPPDSASPEYRSSANHSVPSYSKDFPPNSQTPVPSPKDGMQVRSSSDDSDTYSDSGGYSRRMPSELKKISQNNEESQTESEVFGDTSPMLPLLREEDGIKATAAEFYSPPDGEALECPNAEIVKDNDLHFSFRRGYPRPLQHFRDL